MNKDTEKNFLYKKNNPFENECKDCTKNIWNTINNRVEELNMRCYPNTYIWIEKFKDNNY